MSGPGPRAMLRGFAAALLVLINLILTTYTGVDDQMVAAISGVYMAAIGVAESLYDAQRAKSP